MQTWAPILLGNTLMAGALAIAAMVVMRLRRPAIAHALWLLVLIKLVTPPLWNVPIPQPTWQADQATPAIVAHMEADAVRQTIRFAAPPEMVETTVMIPEGGTLIVGPALPEKKPFQAPSVDSMLIGLWITGSILWLMVLATRMRRFSRLAKRTTKAPAQIQERADLLARALHISQSPPVELVPASISPMLWHDLRSTRLLVPEQLLRTLDPEQRDALILHELAHLKRMDHLTRFLEILVTAIFWWHPVVWIARRGLREAEEQCCDAWVIWAMPDSARRYADALVDTLDFLAASPQSLPPGASGLGGLHHLQRRLTMIFTHTPPRAMSWNGRIAIFGLIGLLPLGPVWSQQPQPVAPEGRRELVDPPQPGVRTIVGGTLTLSQDALGNKSQVPATGPATSPVAAIDPATIPQEQLMILRSISTVQGGGYVAELLNVATGQMRGFEGSGRFINGDIKSVTAQGVLFAKGGVAEPVLISPGMNLEGTAIGSVEAYRLRLLGSSAPLPASRRGGRGGASRGGMSNPEAQQYWAGMQGALQPAAVTPPDKAVVMALLEALADPSQAVSENAQQALAGFGRDALPIYIEATSSPTSATRVGSLRAIRGVLELNVPYRAIAGGYFGGGAGGFGRGGQAQFSNSNQGRRGRGGRGMSQYGNEIQAQVAPIAVKALSDPEAEVRQSAADVLPLLIDQPDAAIPAMAKLLDSEETNLRVAGLTGLATVVRYRGANPVVPHLPAISKRLGDKVSECRLYAVNLLGNCGPAARSAVPELLTALKDTEAGIRAAAATALGQIQAPPPAVEPNSIDAAVNPVPRDAPGGQ